MEETPFRSPWLGHLRRGVVPSAGVRVVDLAARAGQGVAARDADAGLQEPARHAILLYGELGVAAAGGLEPALGAEMTHERGAMRPVEPDGAEREALGGGRLERGAEDDHAGEGDEAPAA